MTTAELAAVQPAAEDEPRDRADASDGDGDDDAQAGGLSKSQKKRAK